MFKKIYEILKEAELNSIAQQIIESVPDSNSEEFAHKIFEKLLEEIKIDSNNDST
jgi:hypothetical protein